MVDYVVEDPCRAQVQERRQKTETEACQAEKTRVEDDFRSCRSNRGSPEEVHFPRKVQLCLALWHLLQHVRSATFPEGAEQAS